MGAGADGVIKIYTDVDTKGIQNGTKQIESSMNRIGSIVKKIGGVIAAAFAVRKVIEFGKECLELGSDLQEVQNVVDSVFTTMSDKVDEFAKNAAHTAGLSETMAKKYTGTFGAMAKSFKFTEAEAMEMSTTLTQLSGDVASFYNLSQDEAYTKLKSVFTGETESLKELGVVMTQVALDQYALANGFGQTTANMSEQEKVALRYRFVLDQLSTASGDFIRTSGGWANQVRILKLQFDSLKATIGQGLINVFTPVIKVINILLAKLATVANAFKAFTSLIFGNASSGGSSGGMADAAAGYESAAAGAENYAGATSDAANATKEAAKAAKGYLSSLDEIKTLNSDSGVSSSGSSGGGGGGISGGMAVDFGSVEQGESVVDQVNSSFDELFATLKENIQPLTEQLSRFGEIAKSAFSWLLNNVLKPLASFTISEVVPRFFETLANVLFVINNILIALQPLWQWFWDNVLLPIATWTAGVFLSSWDSINAALKTFGEWCAANPEIVQTIAIAIASFFAAFKITKTVTGITKMVKKLGGLVGIVKTVGKLVSSVLNPWTIAIAAVIAIGVLLYKNWDTIKAKAIEIWGGLKIWFLETTQSIGNYFKTLWTNIKTTFANVGTWFKGKFQLAYSNIKAAFVNIAIWFGEKYEAIKTVFANTAIWFKGKFTSAYSNIKTVFKNIGTWFSGKWTDIKEVFKNIPTWFRTKFSSAYSNITKQFRNIGTFFSKIWDGITTYISNTFLTNWNLAWNSVKTALGSVWNLMVTTVKGPVNSIIGLINSMINAVETGLNWIIGGANKISFSIPEWIPEIGGNTFGINITPVDFANIPLLAQGAVIPANKEFLAVLGDQKHGQNLEAPEGLIRKIVREESGKGGGVIKLIVQLNRRTIYEELISEAKLRQMQTGSNPFDLA